MKRLLNITTYDCDLDLVDHDWRKAGAFCAGNGFDGFELYPAGDYDFEKIPVELVTGLHLRFFPILSPMWRGDRPQLLEIFGDDETVEQYYGGPDRRAIVDLYRRQLALATRLGCDYVVFHVSQSEVESVYTGRCRWTWPETAQACAEIVNDVMRESAYEGEILFENLWFPGDLRLDSCDQVAFLLQQVEYPRCGLVLDTGHVLNNDPDIGSEAEGIAHLLDTVRNLGDLKRSIRGVHLTLSLSGEYVKQLRGAPSPFDGVEGFWERLAITHRTVFEIDQHDAFDDPAIARLFDLISPEYLVFEFSYRDLAEWQGKIDRQKRALSGLRPAGGAEVVRNSGEE